MFSGPHLGCRSEDGLESVMGSAGSGEHLLEMQPPTNKAILKKYTSDFSLLDFFVAVINRKRCF